MKPGSQRLECSETQGGLMSTWNSLASSTAMTLTSPALGSMEVQREPRGRGLTACCDRGHMLPGLSAVSG